MRLGSGVAVAQAAAAPIQLPTWEPPYATGVALIRKKRPQQQIGPREKRIEIEPKHMVTHILELSEANFNSSKIYFTHTHTHTHTNNIHTLEKREIFQESKQIFKLENNSASGAVVQAGSYSSDP